MSKDNLEELFSSLKDGFDIEVPSLGHEARFQEKLKNKQYLVLNETKKPTSAYWRPLLAVAASLLIFLSITFTIFNNETERDLASVSPEMAQTQDFFTSTIETELAKIKNESSPEVKSLVEDTMKQMQNLENDYQNLKQDLTVSGDDSRVIYAMISNFQNRIYLLQSTLEQINNVKQFNTIKNENKTTI